MLASTKLSHRVQMKQYNFPLSILPLKRTSLRPCDLQQTKWDAAATTALRRSPSIPRAPWIDNAFLHVPLFFQKECIRGQILILPVIWRSYTSGILGWAFWMIKGTHKGAPCGALNFLQSSEHSQLIPHSAGDLMLKDNINESSVTGRDRRINAI